MSRHLVVLPGEDTLIGSWAALTRLSPGARMRQLPTAVAAVFPAWAPLNNAILRTARPGSAAVAAAELSTVFADAGVAGWALWVPSLATDLDTPDSGRPVRGLQRDTTTLVMVTSLSRPHQRHDGAVRTSIATATRASDEPVPVTDLEPPEEVHGLDGWVMLNDGVAVVGAWTYLQDRDCGVYSVGTQPAWRRRGFATALMEHLLADAASRGARTASLQSTRMGQPLYASLGFRAAGRYEEWVPRSPDRPE